MDSPRPVKNMRIWSVAALGIGSMVGAGIFSLMGQAAIEAGNAVYISFLIGGIIAFLSGLTYAHLGVRYPSSGGIIDYFNTAFGIGTLSGGLSLVYCATLVITIAMVAQAFGAYGASLCAILGMPGIPPAILSSLAIVVLGVLNMLNAGLVGRAEVTLVCIKLGILVILIMAGIPSIHSSHFSAGIGDTPLLGLFGSVGLTFFAYSGYGMMANASANLINAKKELPRAIFLAIGIVMALYVVLSIVIMHQVSPQELAEHADTAVAQAAAPILGKAGYIAVSFAALIATSSAINATFFSTIRIAQGLAAQKELGKLFTIRAWKNGSWGYVLSIVLILLIAYIFNLGETAKIAGATFLISYLAVYIAHWKLRKNTHAHPLWIILGFFSMLAMFIGYLVSLYVETPLLVAILIGIMALCFLFEWFLQWRFRRSG
ncbi:APC family permease [Akkermansia glycaniphila]|uniref:Amino acid permease n=1 Tax=Akkermansia glycaniphila TaxID=1679444 RepID=A0A1C7PDA2_9BACT|nr:APC family permease [Akkermansia glycaniphila]OCA03553.1 hypothetical protein AC781_03795 [Akkermansia glycaniphila]SEH74380.1 amino acid permease [Akkermansia glycaniphila]